MEENVSLESSIRELEAIIKQMESQEVTLEESFKLYKEGVMKLKSCNEMIDCIEKEITILEES